MALDIVNTPAFTHDCDACTFLGHAKGHDHYICEDAIPSASLIARRSSEGPDYSAWTMDLVNHLPDTHPIRVTYALYCLYLACK